MVNFNTETEWTNLQGKTLQYGPRDSGIRVGQVIVFDVILSSGAKFSVAVGLAIAGFAMPYPPLQLFMVVTGCILTGILYLALRDEWDAQLDLLDQHIEKRKPAPAPETTKAPPQEIVIRRENATGYNERTIKVPNPPSAAFLIAVYRSRQSTGRIPGERFFADPAQFGDKADAWLDVLEQLEIVEKIGEYETSPRRWSDHWTLKKALQVFGYVDEWDAQLELLAEHVEKGVPAQVPPQLQIVRAQPPATPKITEK